LVSNQIEIAHLVFIVIGNEVEEEHDWMAAVSGKPPATVLAAYS